MTHSIHLNHQRHPMFSSLSKQNSSDHQILQPGFKAGRWAGEASAFQLFGHLVALGGLGPPHYL